MFVFNVLLSSCLFHVISEGTARSDHKGHETVKVYQLSETVIIKSTNVLKCVFKKMFKTAS